jgi:hypothetical protein
MDSILFGRSRRIIDPFAAAGNDGVLEVPPQADRNAVRQDSDD